MEKIDNCLDHFCLRYDLSEGSPTTALCKLPDKEYAFYKTIIANNFKTVNWVFISMITLSTVVIFSKVYDVDNFKWNDIVFPLKHTWIVFLILAVIHFYFAHQLKKSIEKVHSIRCYKLQKEIYLDITSGENVFFRGLNPKPSIGSMFGKTTVIMHIYSNKADMAFYLRAACNILIFVAMTVTLVNMPGRFILLIISQVIFILNAFVGSYYLIPFYRLAYGVQGGKFISLLDNNKE